MKITKTICTFLCLVAAPSQSRTNLQGEGALQERKFTFIARQVWLGGTVELRRAEARRSLVCTVMAGRDSFGLSAHDQAKPGNSRQESQGAASRDLEQCDLVRNGRRGWSR